MAIRNNTLSRKALCQLYFEPAQLEKYIGSDFAKAAEIYKIGYDHTWSQRELILNTVNNTQNPAQ